ncbi:GNAT family N-acetyltransferase [Thalassotalea sp. Y01]|uniref:GNAT family N-acetyltransferase n=1 Tax=Thalassotalea sp. Y01 TaxID=2729613 RepID=UPI00145D2BA4|nr:GNAT family N-acetyltransferase [Thalassotalea sp. Y01]NMP17601.1 GNAT family N-acetyltransferase [Thalassotalea sp. Y01]
MENYKLTTLETDRLLIRTTCQSDWPFVYSMQSDPEQMLHIKEPQSDEQIKSWFVEFLEPFRGEEMKWSSMIGIDKTSGEPIGCFSVRMICKNSQNAELGYMISKHHKRQGYASEGAKAIKQYLFDRLNLRRVTAYCNETNTGSWKVMENIGLQREGMMRQEYRINDVWHNTLIYGEVNPNYRHEV